MMRPVTVASLTPEIRCLISILGCRGSIRILTARSEATMRAAASSVKKSSAEAFFSLIILKTSSRVMSLLDERICFRMSSKSIFYPVLVGTAQK